MRHIALSLLVAGWLTGCAQHYDMMLTNGVRISNVRKPTLDRENSIYVYKDATGQKRYVTAGRVVEIKPHSNAPHDNGGFIGQ